MNDEESVKREILQSYGDAYKAFGLSKLMGHIVALLIFSPEPLSLDEISEQLSRSKGPVSQILRRLSDKHLIRKVWHPGSRKDYWEVQPDIFENSFRNNFELIKNNTRIARNLRETVQKAHAETGNYDTLQKRVLEMEKFFELNETHFQNLLDDWAIVKKEL